MAYMKKKTNEAMTVGVLTSGGDAPGMNAAVRAVVRCGIVAGFQVKGIRRGYTGLLEEDIFDMNARSVADIIQKGGTILYTARCPEMMRPEGQEKAAFILKITESMHLLLSVATVHTVVHLHFRGKESM